MTAQIHYKFSAKTAIRLIPPITIKPAIIIINKPIIILYRSVPKILIFERASILNAPSRLATILLTCPIFPMPNEAKIVNIAKSIASNHGNATYRGTVRIKPSAVNSIANVKCDTIILDETGKSDTIPKNICLNSLSTIEHEATVSKVSDEKLFYLKTKGIDEDKAREMIIMGFIDEFKEELPMEYAVELNKLLKNKF